MAPHSSTFAWKILWTEKPGRLQSMGSLRVGYDWATSLSLFTFHFHALEKEMATHSSVLAWRIPGTGEPWGLPSMGSHRVGHDWSDLAAAVAVLSSFVTLLKLFVNYLEGQYSQWVKWSKINLSHGRITHVLYNFFFNYVTHFNLTKMEISLF